MTDQITSIVSLITAVISLITALISLRIARKSREQSASVDTRLQEISSGNVPICIEGPTHTYGSPGHVTLRVKLAAMGNWMFVAVSQNAPDSVWVQQLDRPDPEGRLSLEAYQFKGRYAVYAAYDDTTITRFQKLQAQAARGQAATVADLPKGAFKICESVA